MPGEESWERGATGVFPLFQPRLSLPSCFTFALSRNGVTFATAMPRLSNPVGEKERKRKREDVGDLEMARVAASTKLQGVLTYGQRCFLLEA